MVSFSTLPWATILIGALVMSTANAQFSLTNLIQSLSGAGAARSDNSLGDGESGSDTGSAPATTGTGRFPGSRVGPFFLFRSSADNAEIVNDAFRGTPVMRALGLAFGDEFPKLRDDLIQRQKSREMTGLQRMMAAFTNLQNWSFDRENNKKEMEKPFVRPSRMLVNSLRGTIGSLTGGSSGGGLGGALSGLLGGSSSASTAAPAFKISID